MIRRPFLVRLFACVVLVALVTLAHPDQLPFDLGGPVTYGFQDAPAKTQLGCVLRDLDKQGEKYVESRVQEGFRDHSLFVAYAPANKPRIALAVIVENAGFGARAAAPIARQVLDYYFLGQGTKNR